MGGRLSTMPRLVKNPTFASKIGSRLNFYLFLRDFETGIIFIRLEYTDFRLY